MPAVRLLIRADGDSVIGTGHVMRMIGLAQCVMEHDGEVAVAAARLHESLAARLRQEGVTVVEGRVSPGSDDDAAWSIGLFGSGGYDWLAVDGYAFGGRFQRVVHRRGIPQLVVDDHRHCDAYVAELVLNQNSSASADLYHPHPAHTELLLGPRYALLRREFRQRPRPPRRSFERARRALVTMGGADPASFSPTVIRALRPLLDDPGLEVRVVAGGANPRLRELAAECDDPRLTLLTEAADLPALMEWADVAVAAAGSTVWELAFMGTPALLVVLAENQVALASSLDALGAARNLGWHHELSSDRLSREVAQFLADAELRAALSAGGRALVDGGGCDRVLERITRRLERREP